MDVENKLTIKRMNKDKCWIWKKSSGKTDEQKITKEDIILNPADIKKLTRRYCTQLYVNTCCSHANWDSAVWHLEFT